MDGCEVGDRLELGFNLFTANSDLQVLWCNSKHFFTHFEVTEQHFTTHLYAWGAVEPAYNLATRVYTVQVMMGPMEKLLLASPLTYFLL